MGVSKTFQKRLALIENIIEIEKKKLTSNSNNKN